MSLVSTPSREDSNWTTVIEAEGRPFDFRFRELWTYRDLIWLFVRRDFVARYKQTILGPLWHVIQPLFTTVIFTVVFGNIAGISTDGLPQFLFYMSGIVLWQYFSKSLTATSNTFVKNANMFGKVYFPRLSVPVSILFSNLISFAIQFTFFLGFVAYYYIQGAAIQPTSAVILLPLLIALMATIGLGLGIIISSMTTKYRDLSQLVSFGTSLLMYATPVIYPLSTVPEKYRWVLEVNPITPIVETFRYAILGAGSPSLTGLIYSTVFALVTLVVGILIFNRTERTFMDTV